MTSDLMRFAGSDFYDAAYYGVDGIPKANYRDYKPASVPHWARPLAVFIAQHTKGPVLDVGCAYGHLVREINTQGVPAYGIDWSKYATERKVTPFVERQDARSLWFPDSTFSAITSLDLLEHFEPADTLRVIAEMVRVAQRGALFVHVIGAHNPAEDVSRHLEDPSHANHEPLNWYLGAFAKASVFVDDVLTGILKQHPVFAPTDWAGRIVALRNS